MIEAVDLSKHYGSFVAVDRLTFTIRRGEVVAFLGPNGAGKSTTMKVLTGYLSPSGGQARLCGIDVVQDRVRAAQKLGYLPENGPLYPEMTPRELLTFFGEARGMNRAQLTERIAFVTKECALEELLDKPIGTCSKGQKQRVGMAQALLHDPEVLIFDEPANGLDPKARVEMRELLLRLAGMGKTLIVTSHILPELARICDRVAILSGGGLRAAGTLAEIMKTVTQARLLEIQLNSADQVDAAAAILGEFAGPGSEVVRSESERTVQVRTSRREDEWHELASKLIGAGVRFSQLREIQTDLEDAYLSVTEPSSKADAKRSVTHV